MSKSVLAIGLFIIAAIAGCREEYRPEVKSLNQSFLVVDGNINPSADSTYIRLTRTFKLSDTARLRMESNAIVTVEGKDNSTRMLIPQPNGLYVSPGLNLTIGDEYRLHIKTTDGREFLSAYVKARTTPPIDSISRERDEDGVWLYANTHDPTNASRYYRWEFDETWEINSRYLSHWVYEPPPSNTVRPRVFPAEDVSKCWKYNSSNEILLANSSRLQNDVINRARLTLIPSKNERLSVRYSMMLRQYALDKEAYNFLELMKKNTEEIGAIFTPQPSELRGNIQCISHPEEYVLGYVTVSTVEKQRIFITTPPGWGFSLFCIDYEVPDRPDSIQFYFGGRYYLPYSFIEPPPRYASSSPECVDCTVRGGFTAKPSYW